MSQNSKIDFEDPPSFMKKMTSPHFTGKNMPDQSIDITRTDIVQPEALNQQNEQQELFDDNMPPSSEVRCAIDFDAVPNSSMTPQQLTIEKPLLQQGPLATIGREKGATINQFFNKQGLDMASGLKQRDPQNSPEMGNAVESKAKQGVAFGVFFPVLQNILGVLLFIRVPQITGQSGVSASVLIVGLATLTTFFTVLSTAAIATNGKIKLGGSYYLISRSLGPPSGGSVGILFYLGTTFAGAMYILGAVEALLTSLGQNPITGNRLNDMRILGLCVLVMLTFIAYVGISIAAKIGIVFLIVVLLSITSMYIGCFTVQERYVNGKLFLTGLSLESFKNNWPFTADLQLVFQLLAVYFPSVTGIMAGANRSGDLANPSRSIPIGSIAAQITTTFIYLSFPILFGFIATRQGLQYEDWLFTAEIAWPASIIVRVGIILSSVGAGLQTIVGAPRILQAVANDQLIKPLNYFAKDVKRPLMLTSIICLLACMIGDINVVTPIITMFFLLCYGYVNLACFMLEIHGSLNWRPKWKCFHWTTALLGILLCAALMFMISWYSALIAIVFLLLLYYYIDKKNSDKNWGDSIEGMKAERARNALFKVNRKRRDHVKNWRPHVLAVGSLNLKVIAAEIQERKLLNREENEKLKVIVENQNQNGRINQNPDQQSHNNIILNIPNSDAQVDGNENHFNRQDNIRKKKKGRCSCKRKKKQLPPGYKSPQQIEKQELKIASNYILDIGVLDFIHQIKKNTGLAIYGATIPGKYESEEFEQVMSIEQRLYKKFIHEQRKVITKIFITPKADVKNEYSSSDSFLVQASGLGGLEPNSVLLGWPTNWKDQNEKGERFMSLLRMIGQTGRMALVLKPADAFQYEYVERKNGRKKKVPREGNIDIWSFTYESGTLLLFAFILQKAKYWKKCKVRLFSLTHEDKSLKVDFERTMKEFLKDVRLDQMITQLEEIIIDTNSVQRFTQDLQKKIFEREKVIPEQFRKKESAVLKLGQMDQKRLAEAKEKMKHRKISKADDEYGQSGDNLDESLQYLNLNKLIYERSKDSELVIMNMPDIYQQERSADYLHFGEEITQGLKRVLLIKNSGKEVITEYT